MKLANMTYRELESLQLEVEAELNSRQKKQAAIDEVMALAASKGIDLADLSREFSANPTKRVLGPAPIKFQHPEDSSKVWSGRGREPLWYKEALAGGTTLETMRV